MKLHTRYPYLKKTMAWTSVCLLLASLGVASTDPIDIDRSVASTNQFKAPKIRTSEHIDPEYRYRFHPRHRFSFTVPYRITNPKNMNIRTLKANYPIWARPVGKGAVYTSTTTALSNAQQSVEIKKIANNNAHKYYLIVSGGHTYGWVPSVALNPDNGVYHMPFHYYSQLYPTYAPDACEAVALRMALSVKGRDPHMSMKKFIKQVPRNPNPDNGYNANPFKYGDGASIYPPALAKYGKRFDKKIFDATGITEKAVIKEVEHGNPVVFEGSYLMHDTSSDHTLVLIGYSKGDNYFEFADPFHYRSDKTGPISVVKASKFKKIFTADKRGLRAVVVR